MHALTKDTSVKLSLATMIAVMLWMGGASWKVFGYVQLINNNTVAIQNIGKSVRLGRIDDYISDLQAEVRQLDREIIRFPNEGFLQEQKAQIQHRIEHLKRVRQCVVEGGDVCE